MQEKRDKPNQENFFDLHYARRQLVLTSCPLHSYLIRLLKTTQ